MQGKRHAGQIRFHGILVPVDAVHEHRARNVLQRAIAKPVHGKFQFADDLLMQRTGDADVGRLRDLLQPRRHVDAVAEQVAAVNHHVAKIEANAELHAPFRREIGVSPFQIALDRDRCPDRLHGALELGDQAVAGRAEDAPPMLVHEARDRRAVGGKRCERAFLVGRDKATVASDIGSKDYGELPFQEGSPSRGILSEGR